MLNTTNNEGTNMNPTELAEHYGTFSRNTGRTTALVMSLPAEPCFIMVHDISFGEVIKELIKKHRPEYNLDNVTIISKNAGTGWRDSTISRNKHIYIDHQVLERDMIHQVKGINDMYGKKAA
jgi:hypothetical protein